jgi:glycosyltransferase involved in cell wall biosynthesis
LKLLLIHPHDIRSPNEPWTIRVDSLAREFRDRGHEVTLAYTPLEVDEQKRNPELNGVTLVTLSRKVGLPSLWGNVKKVLELTRQADVVHFQKCFHFVSIPALLAGLWCNKPLHYEWDDWEEKIWYHSNNRSLHTRIFGMYLKLLERYLPVLSDTVSVASHKLEELCLCYGVAQENIYKAPVGADLRQFSPRLSGQSVRRQHHLESRKMILYLGQLHAGQYVRMFIEAANLVLRRHPEAVFLIIGQGYMEGALRSCVKEYGIEGGVVFAGSVSHDRVPHYIAAADICVACFEDNEVTVCKSPLKIVEYLASGKPIVASLVGEVRNMVGGVGLLTEPGDHRGLAEAIITLLGNPGLREEMGLRARRRGEARYHWGYAAENLLNAYRKGVQTKGDGHGRVS